MEVPRVSSFLFRGVALGVSKISMYSVSLIKTNFTYIYKISFWGHFMRNQNHVYIFSSHLVTVLKDNIGLDTLLQVKFFHRRLT